MQKTAKKAAVWTYSRLATLMTCERLEYFQYSAGGHGIVPLTTPDYYVEGEFGHYALMHFYRIGRMLRANMLKRAERQLAELGPMEEREAVALRAKLAALIGMAHGYKVRYASDLEKWKVVAVEKVFETKVGGHALSGRLDLVVEDPNLGVGFVEHKFLSSVNPATYETLPLNLQQLIECYGVKAVTGVWPSWYQWNIIKKTTLKQKGLQSKVPGKVLMPEPLEQYEARVTQQYLEEPDKMFFRPPVCMVSEKAVAQLEAMLVPHIEAWHGRESFPPMRFSGCMSSWGQPCAYASACRAALEGRGNMGEGWDAPECRAFFKKKTVTHPELQEDDEAEVEVENAEASGSAGTKRRAGA